MMKQPHHGSDDSLEGGGDTRSYGSAMVPLPDDFSPGENDVIVGRGKAIRNWSGNGRFRELVASRLEEYSVATSKLEKSAIVTAVLYHVRNKSPNGGFIKKDPLTGKWFEVGDFVARERVTQCFRDELHGKYRSSNSSKKQRRKEELRRAKEAPSTKKRKSETEQQRVGIEGSRTQPQHAAAEQRLRIEDSIAQLQPTMPGIHGTLPGIASSPTSNVNSFLNQPLHTDENLTTSVHNLSAALMPSLQGQADLDNTTLPLWGLSSDQQGMAQQQEVLSFAGLPENMPMHQASYPNSWFRMNSQDSVPASASGTLTASSAAIPVLPSPRSNPTMRHPTQFGRGQISSPSSLMNVAQTLDFGSFADDDDPFEPRPIADNISRRHSQFRD